MADTLDRRASGRLRRRPSLAVAVAALAAVALLSAVVHAAPRHDDPLAVEIARWSSLVATSTSTDPIWIDVRDGSKPLLANAESALRAGRRFLALQRLAAVRSDLGAAVALGALSAKDREDAVALEAEWKRIGTVLGADLKPAADALGGVRPAAVRALAEAALPEVRGFYDASLEYGRSAGTQYGRFYLAAAEAQREFVRFMKALPAPPSGRAPRLRPLLADIDALESELLALYRPPASIDRHPEFIGASAALKEARELDAAGLRYGALLRYLQTALRLAPLRPAAPALEGEALAARLGAIEARLGAGQVDHTLGRMFLEAARSHAEGADIGASRATATAIAGDVLPRYFAALGPAPAREPKPQAAVTVTLVRWPYT